MKTRKKNKNENTMLGLVVVLFLAVFLIWLWKNVIFTPVPGKIFVVGGFKFAQQFGAHPAAAITQGKLEPHSWILTHFTNSIFSAEKQQPPAR
jgi:hypothetical protein